MDYMQFVDYHRTSGADITIGCIAYDESRASDFGLMKVGAGYFGVQRVQHML
jgi:glucose-1-phosphate adenylyltransferase